MLKLVLCSQLARPRLQLHNSAQPSRQENLGDHSGLQAWASPVAGTICWAGRRPGLWVAGAAGVKHGGEVFGTAAVVGLDCARTSVRRTT